MFLLSTLSAFPIAFLFSVLAEPEAKAAHLSPAGLGERSLIFTSFLSDVFLAFGAYLLTILIRILGAVFVFQFMFVVAVGVRSGSPSAPGRVLDHVTSEPSTSPPAAPVAAIPISLPVEFRAFAFAFAAGAAFPLVAAH